VYAICAAIRALTGRGEAVLIQQPVYYPFAESVTVNGRKLVVNELLYQNGRYTIDYADFEEKIRENRVRLFILCSPHNPVGRVWSAEELTRLGEICLRHGVLIVSDEIHADFVYPGQSHSVLAALEPALSACTVTCTAPTKTFNLAGIQISNIIIENWDIRRKFRQEIEKSGYSQANIMGMIACQAAYAGGKEWLTALKAYLFENLAYIRDFLQRNLPRVRLVEPEGSYLVWLDFRELGLDGRQLDNLIVNEAGLWLDSGEMFGLGGEGFQRINIACPRKILGQALLQLKQAMKPYSGA
jgi:cystathionine beta-lyase